MRTIPELFAHAADAGMEIETEAGRTPVAALAERACAVAAGLRDLGVTPGERVACWLPNSPDYLTLQAATARLGAILVAVNNRFGTLEVADIVGRSESRVLVVADAAALPALRHLVVLTPGETDARSPWSQVAAHGFAELAATAPGGEDLSHSDALSNIFTTSGTTAAPKFAAHAQSSVVGHAVDVAAAIGLSRPDCLSLQLLPYCGVFGFGQATGTLAAGVDMLMPAGFDAAVVARTINERGVTHLLATDDMIHRMLDSLAPDAAAPVFPSLRVAAFALFNSALSGLPDRAEALGVPMRAPFGMSEVFALFAVRGAEDTPEDRHRAGGRLINEGARVRVRDPESGDLLPHGAVGELEIKGPYMFREYFGNPAASRAAMTDDGYLRTGDLGYTESADAFTYLQRANDTLRLSGLLVSPAEIESVVMEQAGIHAAQVVAVGTENGNRPVAFVITEDGAAPDEAAVIAGVGRVLPKFKTPVRVIALAEFPVTKGANGTKIQRAKLRQMAEAALAAG